MPVRNYTRRRLIQIFGRPIQALLAKVVVSGREHIPRRGPLIIVSNHSGYAEPILMVTTMPWPVEILAAGDVPMRSGYMPIANLYGSLAVNRGEIDRAAMKACADVLEGEGSLVIFPEGGIWARKIGDARLGVAYLSQQTQTPILPIGFGGVIGAVEKAFSFKRPRVTVNIGKLIPPVPTSENYRERKAIAQKASDRIMESIYALVPPDDEANVLSDRQEAYTLDVQLNDSSGVLVPIAPELTISNGDELSMFFHRPVLISVVIDNLERSAAEPLRHLDTERDPARFSAALREALIVYVTEKPHFIGYRLGYQRAERIVRALQALAMVADWAAERQLSMNILPRAVYTYSDGHVEKLDYPEPPHDH